MTTVVIIETGYHYIALGSLELSKKSGLSLNIQKSSTPASLVLGLWVYTERVGMRRFQDTDRSLGKKELIKSFLLSWTNRHGGNSTVGTPR